MTPLDPKKDYHGLRTEALNLTPAQVKPGQEFPSVYGVLMEIGMLGGAVTLVTLADGTVSLYYENGGGILGGGRNDNVKEAAFRFIQMTEQRKECFIAANDFPLPDKGKVKFYVLTAFDGVLTADMAEEDLTEENPLSKLIVAGNAILTELRLAQDKAEKKEPRFKDKLT